MIQLLDFTLTGTEFRLIFFPLVILIALFLLFLRRRQIERFEGEQGVKEEQFKDDKRAPILYLRPFSTDGMVRYDVRLPGGYSASAPMDSVEMFLERRKTVLCITTNELNAYKKFVQTVEYGQSTFPEVKGKDTYIFFDGGLKPHVQTDITKTPVYQRISAGP